ncbi:hypothetical protein TGP89_262880C, partial [Toxoplasma gondii p89]
KAYGSCRVAASPLQAAEVLLGVALLRFSLVSAHAVDARPHFRCIVSSFDKKARRVRLLANVLTKENEGAYRLPDSSIPGTVLWPQQRGGKFPDTQVIDVPLDNPQSLSLGTGSAYVVVVEPSPSSLLSTSSSSPSSSSTSSSTSTSTSSPSSSSASSAASSSSSALASASGSRASRETGNLKKGEGRRSSGVDGIPFSIVCSANGALFPLPLDFPVRRSIAADASHFYSFSTPVYNKDIVISLASGAVGDADLFVSPLRTVSSASRGYTWSSTEIGTDWVLLAAESKDFRSVCNASVISSTGFCTFFILVEAQEDAQYTLEVRQENGGVDALVPGRPVHDIVRKGHTKMYSYVDVTPDEDLKITVSSDRDVSLYASLGSGTLVTDLTPLHLGSAQWWSDGVARRSIDIKGADLRRRQAVLGCIFPNSKDAAPWSSRSVEKQCVLRVDVSAHQDQRFSLELLTAPTNSVVTNLIVDATPNIGFLWENSDVKYELWVEDFILERDLDAALHLKVASFDCKATLTVKWPDGFRRDFPWPQSRQLVIGREIHPWTEGPFFFMLHDPSIRQGNCMYVFNAHISTTLHETHEVTPLDFNVPLRAAVTSHRPSFFVWSAPFSGKADDEFFLLKVTPFVHMVDVFVQPLHRNLGFPKRPEPGEELPPTVKQLVQESPESPTLFMRIGSVWRDADDADWVPACEPNDLATSRLEDDQLGTDTEDVFHPLDSCQILISVYDHHRPTDLSESREIDFSIQVTSRSADAFDVYSFGETRQFVPEEFLGENQSKALLLYQDNPSADVHLHVRCEDPFLISKMTAALFHNLTRLHEELEHPNGCRSDDGGKFCWVSEPTKDWQSGSTADIVIKAEEKVLESKNFLYVVLYLNETYSSTFQPVVEFSATQEGMYVPLKNNIDSGIYSVAADKPAFFSFEVA